MDANEAYRAMMNGETVVDLDGCVYQIRHGDVQMYSEFGWTTPTYTFHELMSADFRPYTPRYDLTFLDAMTALNNGKRVACERCPENIYYVEGYSILHSNLDEDDAVVFHSGYFEADWRIVADWE